MAAQRGFLQYCIVSLIASLCLSHWVLIQNHCAPCRSEPHVNRQESCHFSLILLCDLLSLKRRTAVNPFFPSKWWLSEVSSIREPLCELYGAKKVNTITSLRQRRSERPENSKSGKTATAKGLGWGLSVSQPTLRAKSKDVQLKDFLQRAKCMAVFQTGDQCSQ